MVLSRTESFNHASLNRLWVLRSVLLNQLESKQDESITLIANLPCNIQDFLSVIEHDINGWQVLFGQNYRFNYSPFLLNKFLLLLKSEQEKSSFKPLEFERIIEQLKAFLFRAVDINNPSALKSLLDSQLVDINAQNDSHETLLMMSARTNQHSVFSELLKQGPNLRLKNRNGQTIFDFLRASPILEQTFLEPLVCYAFKQWSLEKPLLDIEPLIEDIESAITLNLDIGCAVLHGYLSELYCEKSKRKLNEQVSKDKALCHAFLSEDTGLFSKIYNFYQGLDEEDKSVNLPFCASKIFYYAATEGHESLIQTLIDFGISIDSLSQDRHKDTALIQACLANKIKAVSILLKYNVKTDILDVRGYSAFMYAFDWHDDQNLMQLLSAGVDIEQEDGNGLTSLQYTVVMGQFDLFKKLLNWGANPELLYPGGDTLMAKAISVEALDIIEYLVKEEIAGSYVIDNGETPLIQAVRKELPANILTLLATDQQKDFQIEETGETALMLACYTGSELAISALLSRNVDFHLKNTKGETALDLSSNSAVIFKKVFDLFHPYYQTYFVKRIKALESADINMIELRDFINELDSFLPIYQRGASYSWKSKDLRFYYEPEFRDLLLFKKAEILLRLFFSDEEPNMDSVINAFSVITKASKLYTSAQFEMANFLYVLATSDETHFDNALLWRALKHCDASEDEAFSAKIFSALVGGTGFNSEIVPVGDDKRLEFCAEKMRQASKREKALEQELQNVKAALKMLEQKPPQNLTQTSSLTKQGYSDRFFNESAVPDNATEVTSIAPSSKRLKPSGL